ncbi:MAG TPA: SMC-Scp complex subunit ScpB [Porticoccaceae bacterium]|nr:SMC-Scp complex subunit ScpB [Porticoccaceae bacterium]HCO60063.1 SMC-Scp complex subunit ScpB [Porticoccaceae bacterium]
MDNEQLRKIIEAALMTAGRSLDIAAFEGLFNEAEKPERDEIRATLEDLEADCRDRGYELKRTASGYRFQVKQELSPWIDRLWEEKPRKYSRAVLETLALIAYRQPVTRGDVEQVRGVAVSSEIIRSLQEREWVRTVGHRDVPGRPALYATTRKFLDDFNLASLSELPPLNEIRDLNDINGELGLNPPEDSEDSQSGVVPDQVAVDSSESPGEASEMEDDPVAGEHQAAQSGTDESVPRELH